MGIPSIAEDLHSVLSARRSNLWWVHKARGKQAAPTVAKLTAWNPNSATTNAELLALFALPFDPLLVPSSPQFCQFKMGSLRRQSACGPELSALILASYLVWEH